MKRETTAGRTGGRTPVSGALRGAFRSVLLGWTDPVSGERLTVRMRGEGGLLESLAPLGFEVLERGERPAGPEVGRPARVLSFRAQRAGAAVRSLRSVRDVDPSRGEGGPAAAG